MGCGGGGGDIFVLLAFLFSRVSFFFLVPLVVRLVEVCRQSW